MRIQELIHYTDFIKMTSELAKIETLINDFIGNDKERLKQIQGVLERILFEKKNEILVKGLKHENQ